MKAETLPTEAEARAKDLQAELDITRDLRAEWQSRTIKAVARAEHYRKVTDEIVRIMQVYDEQMAERGWIGTPGGFEHLGDVWKTMRRWADYLKEQP